MHFALAATAAAEQQQQHKLHTLRIRNADSSGLFVCAVAVSTFVCACVCVRVFLRVFVRCVSNIEMLSLSVLTEL